jgi:hypothetical protein
MHPAEPGCFLGYLMKYVKHPEHGNRHIPDEEVDTYVADGWVVWPRPAHVKNGTPESKAEAPKAEAPVKRGPGRPRKQP